MAMAKAWINSGSIEGTVELDIVKTESENMDAQDWGLVVKDGMGGCDIYPWHRVEKVEIRST